MDFSVGRNSTEGRLPDRETGAGPESAGQGPAAVAMLTNVALVKRSLNCLKFASELQLTAFTASPSTTICSRLFAHPAAQCLWLV